MIQALGQPLSFEDFLNGYPDNGKRYELIDGELIELRPKGDHEEIAGRITRSFDQEIARLGLPWFIPKTCCVKPISNIDGYVPDVAVLDRSQLAAELLWKSASTIAQGRSARLVLEVVNPNWQDDYAKKLEDYELLGIAEYWIVDYLALGGRRYIGSPKRPTVSIYSLVDGLYQLQQFRAEERLVSTVFPDLVLTAAEVLRVE